MRSRAGFALAELMIALLVLAVVGGAIHAGLHRQQELFRSLAVMIAARADVRDAAEVLAGDLSAASPLDTLPLAADSAIEFHATIASSVSCDSAPGYTVRMPPDAAEGGPRLTVVSAAPDTGDVMLLYNDDSSLAEPRWDRHVVGAVSSQSAGIACPATTGLTAAGDAAASSLVITLRGPAHPGVRRGAPVRILRRGRYALYRSSDARWYLGHRRCNSTGESVCGQIQPLSGPYEGYAAAGQGGLSLRYFDAGGAQLTFTTAPQDAARIDLAIRATARGRINLGRVVSSQFGDSAAVSIALRNRD